jgi:hypothetical protein
MKNLVLLIIIFPFIFFSQHTGNGVVFKTFKKRDTTTDNEKIYPYVEIAPTFDIGVAGYFESKNSTNLGQYTSNQITNSISTASNELDFSKSRNFGFNFNIVFNLTKHVGLVTGVGLNYNNYSFRENIIINPVYGSFNYDSVTTYSKYKFKNYYIQMPVLIKVQTSNQDFQFAAGPIIGYRFTSKTKAVYKIGSTEHKDFTKDNFNVMPLKLSIGARFNYKGLGFYFTYGLSDFLSGLSYDNPQINSFELMPFEAGITIGAF